MSQLTECDEVLIVEDGKIVENGPPDDVYRR